MGNTFKNFDLREASFSECERYRHLLIRKWDRKPTVITFCMLNPSTADHVQDDPTIRRCINFAKRESFGALHVVNLFGYRATNPAELRRIEDPEGPQNFDFVRAAMLAANLHQMPFVCAWGSQPIARENAARVYSVAEKIGLPLMCLGTSKGGYPKHPLYLAGDTPLTEWKPEA